MPATFTDPGPGPGPRITNHEERRTIISRQFQHICLFSEPRLLYFIIFTETVLTFEI